MVDKNKPSELFEGEGSTLHQAFVGAVERDKKKTKYHCNPLDPDSTLNASNRVVNSQVINEELGLKSQVNNTQSNKYQEIEESFIKYCSDFIINLSYTDERYLLSFISSLLQKQKEQILNLECLKEEEPDEFDDFIGTDRIETKNKLRKEIKEEITKDLFKDFKQVSNPLDPYDKP